MAIDEQEIVLGLLNEVERNSALSQRAIAKNLGIALGLTNACLHRCIKKGFVKVSQAPANRYLYYLTPHGFAEKSRLTAEYLVQSFGFFRTARKQCDSILDQCAARGYQRMALVGASELSEIMSITAADHHPVRLVGIIDPLIGKTSFAGLPVVAKREDLAEHDAVIITALAGGQALFDALASDLSPTRVLVPPMLRVKTTGQEAAISRSG